MKKTFPWVQDYYTARVLLGFSEEEFWRSTPRHVWALKLFSDRAIAPVASNSIEAQVGEIRSLLGI